MNVGDSIKVISDLTYTGILMPRYETSEDSHIVLKLKSGYNIGIELSEISDIKIISSKKPPLYRYFFNKTKILSPFKLNINYQKYKKIFDLFAKKIKQGETYQIKICTKYKNKSTINPVNFFWKLMKINSSPESFMIRDKNFSIVSCSPETLIDKKGNSIITKPIPGPLKKSKKINIQPSKKKYSKKRWKKNTTTINYLLDEEKRKIDMINFLNLFILKHKMLF